MTLRERDLPRATSSMVYGANQRRREDGDTSLRAWREQLAAWGFRRDQADHSVRLWAVYANGYSGDKTEAALPSGRQLKAYSAGKHQLWSHPTQPAPGPNYWLTFRDARALWRDTHITLSPVCESIAVAG